MTQMTISEVARQVGLEPSAIRYYEQIGLVPAPDRISGQRRYETTVLYRLAVILHARRMGFTLEEGRELLLDFRASPRTSDCRLDLSVNNLTNLETLCTKNCS